MATKEQTPEQIQAKADKAAARAKAKADKATAKDTAKADKVAAKAQAKADKAQAKLDAKAAAKQPAQNGVTRPKAATKCGAAWAIFDSVSEKNGSPASIGEAMVTAKEQGLNESNVRAEYARWRKYYGVTGRVAAPVKEAA